MERRRSAWVCFKQLFEAEKAVYLDIFETIVAVCCLLFEMYIFVCQSRNEA